MLNFGMAIGRLADEVGILKGLWWQLRIHCLESLFCHFQSSQYIYILLLLITGLSSHTFGAIITPQIKAEV